LIYREFSPFVGTESENFFTKILDVPWLAAGFRHVNSVGPVNGPGKSLGNPADSFGKKISEPDNFITWDGRGEKLGTRSSRNGFGQLKGEKHLLDSWDTGKYGALEIWAGQNF